MNALMSTECTRTCRTAKITTVKTETRETCEAEKLCRRKKAIDEIDEENYNIGWNKHKNQTGKRDRTKLRHMIKPFFSSSNLFIFSVKLNFRTQKLGFRSLLQKGEIYYFYEKWRKNIMKISSGL